MTLDELWTYAVNYALDNTQGSQHEVYIRRLLDAANGDVSHALRLSTQALNDRGDTYAQLLGGWFVGGPDGPQVQCLRSAGSSPIGAWLPNPKWAAYEPDLIIPWREVYEYVKAGRKRAVQMAMF